MILDLEPLQPGQLRQVYEWDRAQQIEPYETYAARLGGPSWSHYAILDDGAFAGCLSLELTGPTECSIHLAKPPGGDRDALRRLLIDVGILLFRSGFTRLLCLVRPENETAARLVRECGMTETARDAEYITFTLAAEEYFANQTRWKPYVKTSPAATSI